MNTSKPISTISFNTEAFLYGKLNELVDSRIVSFFAYIQHYGEPVECNDTRKDHYHIYIEPNKRIDTMALQQEFQEPIANEKPLGSLPFQSSKFSDWYYYILHDPIYLARKGMSRSYCYTQNEIITSSNDYLMEKVNSINTFEFNCYVDISEYQEKGYSFQQYVIAKNIAPMQIKAYFTAWEIVWEAKRSASHRSKKQASEETHLLDKMDSIIIP